jgi:ABC-type branched-subunit amino acid transport system substrate-binding protein
MSMTRPRAVSRPMLTIGCALATAAALAVAGCSSSSSSTTAAPISSGTPAATSSSSSSSPLYIGAIVSTTGTYAGLGASEAQTLEACASTLKTAAGQSLKIDVVNDQSDPSQAAAAAKQFVANGSVAAIIGGTVTATALGIAPIASQAKVPFLRLTLTQNPGFLSPYIFSSDSPSVELTADQFKGFFASKGIPMSKVLLIASDDASGQTVGPQFQKNGIPNVQLIPDSVTDYAPLVAGWKSRYTGLIITTSMQTNAGEVRQAEVNGKWAATTMIATNSYGTSFLSTAGSTANGAYVVVPPSALEPSEIKDSAVRAEVEKFQAAFQSVTGTDARLAPSTAANAWDQCLSVSLAAKTGAVGSAAREGIKDALTYEKFAGAAGEVQRDPSKDPYGNGLVADSLELGMIQGGALHVVG